MGPLVTLQGSKGEELHLLAPSVVGEDLVAQGYVSTIPDPREGAKGRVALPLRKGRVFRLGRDRYRLLQALEGGTKAVPLSLTDPIVLESAAR